MNETTALHTMNPLNRFSTRATAYAKYRPSYPEEAIAIILEGYANPSQLVVADIGAGTGIAASIIFRLGSMAIVDMPF